MDATSTKGDEPATKPTTAEKRPENVGPAQARLADGDYERCRALLVSDGSRCPLAKADGSWRWCATHAAHHVVLHHEELEHRKPWYDESRRCLYMRDPAQALKTFNAIQESLALRILITEVLHAGDEDDGHRHFVRVTLGCRGNVMSQLNYFQKQRGSNTDSGAPAITQTEATPAFSSNSPLPGAAGQQRISISSCFDRFLALAEARAASPTRLGIEVPGGASGSGSGTPAPPHHADDPDRISSSMASLPQPQSSSAGPSPDHTSMRARLVAKAKALGDLPRLECEHTAEELEAQERAWREAVAQAEGWPVAGPTVVNYSWDAPPLQPPAWVENGDGKASGSERGRFGWLVAFFCRCLGWRKG